ncbi:MAG: hypothetical protein R6X13_06115, partial [bacterium]
MEMKVGPARSELSIVLRDTLEEMTDAASLLVAGLAQLDTVTFDRFAEDDTANAFTGWLKYRAYDSVRYYARQRYFRRRLLSPNLQMANHAAASIAEPLLPVVSEDGTIRYLLASGFTDSAATALMHDLVGRYAESPTAVRESLIEGLGKPGFDGRRDSSVVELFLQASHDTLLTLRRVGIDRTLSTNAIEDARRLGYDPETLAAGALEEEEEPVATAAVKLIEGLAKKGMFTVANTTLVARLRQVAGSLPSNELRQSLVDSRAIEKDMMLAWIRGEKERRDSLHGVLSAYPSTNRPLAAHWALSKLGDTWVAPRLVEIAAAGGEEGGRAIDALYGIDGPEVTLQLESIIKADPLSRPYSSGPKRFGLRKDTLARKLAFLKGWRGIGGEDGLSIDEVRGFGPVAAGRVLRTTGWLNDTTPTPQVEILEYFGRRAIDTLRAYVRSQQAKGDTEPYAFGVAAALLARLGDSEGKRVVSGILGSSSRWSYSKSGAAHVLARTRDRWAVEQLVANRLDTLGKPKSQIYSALGLCPVRAARTAAEADLVSPVPETRLAATQVLAKIGDAASFAKITDLLGDSLPSGARPDFLRGDMLRALADIDPKRALPYLQAEMRYDLARRTYLPLTIHDIANKHPIPEALPLLIQMSNPDRPDRGGPQSGEGLAVANLAAVGGEYAITYLLMRAKAQPGTADAATNWE